MDVVAERILMDTNESLTNYPWAEHRDLISFSVCSEYFEDFEEINNGVRAGFNEVIAVVDKDWLFQHMGEPNPRKYLQEEYTTEDSGAWFDEANRTGHLAMISFN